jgi:hypothetical protein
LPKCGAVQAIMVGANSCRATGVRSTFGFVVKYNENTSLRVRLEAYNPPNPPRVWRSIIISDPEKNDARRWGAPGTKSHHYIHAI